MSPREGRQPLEPAPYPTAPTHTTTSQTTLPSPTRLHYRHQPDDPISASQTTLSYRPDYPTHHRLDYTTATPIYSATTG
nr:hypothetical protein [uncultured Porphyromonas sp.]